MEKKDGQIGQNISSGTEKVEAVASSEAKKSSNAAPKKKTGKKPTPKKGGKSEKSKAKREKERAQKRVEAALAKEERKKEVAQKKAERKQKAAEAKAKRRAAAQKSKAERQKRKDEAKEKRQERRAQAKERAAERKAERKARKALLKSETAKEKAIRVKKERAAKAKVKQEKRERAEKLRLEKRDAKLRKKEERLRKAERKSVRQRTPGFGGWLAAVISLGAVALVLTSLLTYGALNLRSVTSMIGSGYQGTLYEVVGIMDDVDEDLSKVRVSASSGEQSRILTDLLVQTRLAESSLEKMPLSVEQGANVTAFINRTAATAQRLLEKLQNGEKLSDKDLGRLEELYKTNHEVRAVLDELAYNVSDKDIKLFMKSKNKGKIAEGFRAVENLTAPESVGEGGPFERVAVPDAEKGVKPDAIPSTEAENRCKEYFKDYKIKKIEYAGETIANGRDAYNFLLYDENDVRMFAEISKSGELLGFDYYKHCTDRNFDLERSLAIAEDYLKARGYEDMTPVWVSESGAQAEFRFVYDDGQAVYYADTIQVKVCEERGLVSGLDATAYVRNHRNRNALNVKISEAEARERLHKNLNAENGRLTVIPLRGKEIAAYEFICSYDDSEYYVYVDAATGEEAQILLVENSAQGRSLR